MSSGFNFKTGLKCWPRQGQFITCPTCEDGIRGVRVGCEIQADCVRCGLSVRIVVPMIWSPYTRGGV